LAVAVEVSARDEGVQVDGVQGSVAEAQAEYAER